jgi:FAD binding domain of DNA photolyase
MRQLLSEGWMHNRVRMVTAGFLVKDLHVWWPHGARHFLAHLRNGDVASNSHGWQWVAGTGTDASPSSTTPRSGPRPSGAARPRAPEPSGGRPAPPTGAGHPAA